ncbi:deoxynucleoside kinase [Collimonas pratensis]|uniref:Deoxynucleoside kinase family protein n=1 Tax=Collimonas pratensis TaxID=279113 RepID=A0A127R3Q1_9BURK|nr:deoxynucleoside kinase [Collimonas pratensis]AMP07091.1 deoxynucleoside kinase family protein [Collimonas pratensis]AMP16831.1 deoxynucleoside kinase family protein [Collimonas pratensis]NKI71976.1 deoxynucleoside kinase [Collimonas pratensis]
MNLDNYKYIVVEGPIGAGKTTLTNKIAAHLGARVLLEQPQANPFLEKFYRDAPRYALSTQMFFLFQRINQLRETSQNDLFDGRGHLVADFLLAKDAIFASLTLADEELKLYQQMYDHLRPQAATPDLVIYLQAEPETLIERIKKRGIEMESAITQDYLARLCESYSRFFHHYDDAPLLIVNNEHLDLAGSDADFSLLLARIDSMRGKREFFNRGE